MKPKVCVIRTAGTNCDRETRQAFEWAGADAEIIHMNSLMKGYDPFLEKKVSLDDYQILAIPGGFSNGDYIKSGAIFARDLEHFLGEQLESFVKSGKLVIGICNGFQVLVKSGLLPGLDGRKQTTALTYNDSLRYEDRWVKLTTPEKGTSCIWAEGIDRIELPVAHGEGNFRASRELIDDLFKNRQVVFQYTNSTGKPTSSFPENPNASMEAIAGICNPQGTVFGLMPHPERYNHPMNHPLATLQIHDGTIPDKGLGLKIFENGVNYFK
ncbi:MAG: phosphoribosylformylglycinamidine synthase I [Nanoarchaeota archaeon]